MAQRKSARSEVDRIAAPAAAAVFRESLQGTIDQVLEAEMERIIGAGTQERMDDRMGGRSGPCGRTPVTRVGRLETEPSFRRRPCLG